MAKKYAWRGWLLAGIISGIPLGSAPAWAAAYVDPYVIKSPTGTPDTYFGQAVASVGPIVAVGSYVPEPAVYLFDGGTGALLHTIPPPNSGEAFGATVAAANGKLIVGSLFQHAYLFDPTGGTLLQTFAIPGGGNLGQAVAALGSDVLVPAPNQDRVYLFDDATGLVLRTFNGPVAGERFGVTVAAVDDTVLVTAPDAAAQAGVAYVFDGTTAQLLHTLSNPTPDAGDLFGYSSAAGPGGLLVGAPGDDEGGVDGGAAYLFDATTGELLRTYLSPAFAPSSFGRTVAWHGSDVLVGAPGATNGDGVVYRFDAASGTLLATLAPAPDSRGGAGYSLAVAGDDVLAGAVYANHESGAVYRFPYCGNGSNSLGEECDDGNTDSGDGCAAQCFLELCGAAPDPTCRTPIMARAAALTIADSDDATRDKLKWQWNRGAATTADEFGDPSASTPYALCIWDQADTPTPRLVRHLRVPAGGVCAGKSCWKVSASGRVQYTDKAADPTGVKSLQLSPGAAGKAKLKLEGAGAKLEPPLPLTPPVRVELRRAGSAVCWGATYTTPSTSSSTVFKSRSD